MPISAHISSIFAVLNRFAAPLLGGDYLIPGIESPLWRTLDVPESTRRSILQRISQIPTEKRSQPITWGSDNTIWVGRHKISARPRDVAILESRWLLEDTERKGLEIARLLALYSRRISSIWRI